MTRDIDSLQVAADRINGQLPVSQTYLYGPKAVALLRFGMVEDFQIETYRRGLYEQMKERWGQEAADKRTAELRQHHEKYAHMRE